VEKLVRAIVRAQSYIAQGRNLDDLAAIAKKVFPDTDPNILRISNQASAQNV
jgi:ABC-type nitrate/sulfonate/bicarbonate transport system substrate-binding protein